MSPKFKSRLITTATAMVDLSCLVAALCWLLPNVGAAGLVVFLGSYGLAMAAGIASDKPAGLGVLASALPLTVPELPQGELNGGALAFRACYFLRPLVLALLLLAARGVHSPVQRAQQPA